MICSSAQAWQAAIAGVKARLALIPGAAQRAVVQEVAFTWQWAKMTWAPQDPQDYLTGQARASIRVAMGVPDLGFAAPVPRGGGVEAPEALSALMAGMAGADGRQVIYVSQSVPYAGLIERHAHPRALAYEAAKAGFQAADWSQRLIGCS